MSTLNYSAARPLWRTLQGSKVDSATSELTIGVTEAGLVEYGALLTMALMDLTSTPGDKAYDRHALWSQPYAGRSWSKLKPSKTGMGRVLPMTDSAATSSVRVALRAAGLPDAAVLSAVLVTRPLGWHADVLRRHGHLAPFTSKTGTRAERQADTNVPIYDPNCIRCRYSRPGTPGDHRDHVNPTTSPAKASVSPAEAPADPVAVILAYLEKADPAQASEMYAQLMNRQGKVTK